MSESRYHLICLSILALLFAFRVIAQCVQNYFPLDHLPPFVAWQGSSLPYHWLLFFQIIILLIMARQIFLVSREKIIQNRTLGKVLRVLGSLYFGSMFLRLAAGMTFAAENHWFAAKLPSFFHLVLASFVLVLAHYHRTYSVK